MAEPGAALATLRFSAQEAEVTTQHADGWLLERCRQGDLDAFESLFRKYQNYVYNVSLGMLGNGEDAADVTQETFLRIHRGLRRFRGDASFSTWLYRVAVNLCLTELRRRQRRGTELAEERGGPEAEPRAGERLGPSPDEEIVRAEDRRRVRTALVRLPLDYRAVLVLRHYQQLSYEEIAEVLGLSLSQVKTRLFRARQLFKDRYQTLGEERDALPND